MIDTNFVISELYAFMKSKGGSPDEWYIGITSIIVSRLWAEHNVDIGANNHKSFLMNSSEEARKVEKYFIDQLKVDGGSGGGDSNAIWVYLYKKTPATKQ
jgi:hypothetical protein